MKEEDLKQNGQSIVLVAVAMVALVLFVALAVDLSNAYYDRRTAQIAADGGALAGVSQMATSINKLQNKDDKAICRAINDFAERNGIEDTNGIPADLENSNVHGYYVDAWGGRISVIDHDGKEKEIGSYNQVPAGTAGVEVITDILADTYFGGIFGLRGLRLHARAVSLLKEVCAEDCVMPITTHVSVLEGAQTGQCFNIWNENQNVGDEATPGAYGWVNWTWQQSMCDLYPGEPPEGRGCPEVDQKTNGCDADTLPDNLDPLNCGNDVRVGDWMNSTAGIKNADDVRCWLLYYLGEDDPNCEMLPANPEPHTFVIPVYDYTNVPTTTNKLATCNAADDPEHPEPDDPLYTGGGLHYHVTGFARMKLLGFDLSQGQSGQVSAGSLGTDCQNYGVDPHNGNRITAEFVAWVESDDLGGSCSDPDSTIYSAPKIFE